MVNRLIHYMDGAEPLVCHRLDMNTSGVVLFAKTRAAAADVHRQFRERSIGKRYLALTLGEPRWGASPSPSPSPAGGVVQPLGGPAHGSGNGGSGGEQRDQATAEVENQQQLRREDNYMLVDAQLGRHEWHEVARAVRPDGQLAATDVWVLQRAPADAPAALGAGQPALLMDPLHVPPSTPSPAPNADGIGAALVCAAPRTGRTHQIRVHLAAAGAPILGDDLYGLMLPALPQGQALHAAALRLTHPATGEPLVISAPPPAGFQDAMAAMGMAEVDAAALLDLQAPTAAR